ncbi:MAG: hypothetical protein EOP53_27825, partial [Sphingobacteriales bacterium]
SQTYSRGFETEADENAVKLMKRANINPEGLPRFFEKMIAEEKAMFDKIENEQAKAAYKTAMTFLSTHPASEKRMTHLRELIGENKNTEYLDQDAQFKALQDAVKKFVEHAPSAITSKPSDASADSSSSSASSSEPEVQTKKDDLPQL